VWFTSHCQYVRKSQKMTYKLHTDSPVFLVDDEQHILDSLGLFLKTSGIKNVHAIQDSRDLLSQLRQHNAAVIILDLFMPFLSGTQLLPEIIDRYPEIPVIIVTATQEVDTAVSCMKQGAFDYLVKPVDKSRFITSVKRALEMSSLRKQVGNLKQYLLSGQLSHGEVFSNFLTNSPRMRALFQYVEAISESNEPVLIYGETGVGKELMANAIHQLSGRNGESVALNVAGLDDNLFTDTLFGHRKGAFTGANQVRQGAIVKAANGTLFLDEIGDLKKESQVKLLRFLQEGKFFSLGSDVPLNSNARIVTATNCNLRKMMNEGDFRPDLFYRLSSHSLTIPPLRERKEDIPILVSFFLEDASKSMGKETPEPSAELLKLLSTYHFPGNIRELRALIYDSVAQHKSGPVISMDSFKKTISDNTRSTEFTNEAIETLSSALTVSGKFPTLKEGEQLLIKEALKQAGNNQGIAAILLGISRPALNRRLKNN